MKKTLLLVAPFLLASCGLLDSGRDKLSSHESELLLDQAEAATQAALAFAEDAVASIDDDEKRAELEEILAGLRELVRLSETGDPGE